MSQQLDDKLFSTFRQQLQTALEYYSNPEWLGYHSPLATPYFLGDHLQTDIGAASPLQNGQALQKFLYKIAQDLANEDEQGAYYFALLDTSYFQAKDVLEICQDLNISRATYYRHRIKAVQQFEKRLIRQLSPALRLEKPMRNRQTMLNRDQVFQMSLECLRAKQTVAITGSSGIGKTTLATYLANQWPQKSVFWFTVRPGLNDQLSSFLFALGYFLQQLGQPSLWLQMITGASEQNPQLKAELLFGVMRYAIQNIEGTMPLVCIDEVDLLSSLEREQHTQLLACIENLRGYVPLILVGQHIPLETDSVQVLQGFSVPVIGQYLAQKGIHLTTTQLAILHQYTRGNPRLLSLFATLHQIDEPLTSLLPKMSKAPSVEFLLRRIFERLDEASLFVLFSLSVFRRPAPYDVWENNPGLTPLLDSHLVEIDAYGGIDVNPAFKSIFYEQLLSENCEALHLEAATIRAKRGEFTAAVYHYILGGQPKQAIWLWDAHQQQEITQGMGAEALQLFERLSTNQLDTRSKEVLVLLRSRLRLLAGKYDAIKRDLRTIMWQTPLLKGRSKRIEGDIAYAQSRFDSAIQIYQSGVETLTEVEIELALLHKEQSKAYSHKRDLDKAWHEALLAQYEVENMKGTIQSDQGNIAEAHQYFEQALALAIQINHTEGEGKTRNNLAWLLKQQGAYHEAQDHWQLAQTCFEKVGSLSWLAAVKINQAVAYTETGEPDLAIPLLQVALDTFSSLSRPREQAIAHCNLSEAFLALNELDRAEQHAWESIRDEEPTVLPGGLNVLAEVKLAKQEYSAAQNFCQQSIAEAEKNLDHINGAMSWRTLGKTFLAQGQVQEGVAALQQAITIFQEISLPNEVEKTEHILTRENINF